MQAGWLVKENGRWSVTDDGRAAYARFVDPAEFMREASRLCFEEALTDAREIAERPILLLGDGF